MTNEYTVSKGADGALIVVLHPKCGISREEILALLAGLGLDTSEVAFVEPDQAENCEGLQGVPVLIPIDEMTCNLPELDQAGRHCAQAGGRVIALFGPDYSHDGLHPIADKYGTQCGWAVDQLSVRISGQTDEPCTSTGAIKMRTSAKQVDC